MKLPVSAGAIRKLLREIESSGHGEHILAVGGSSERALELRQQFLRGRAAPGAVRVAGPEGADVYVHVFAGQPNGEDDAVLRHARRARVPVIVVAPQSAEIPCVRATDIVRDEAGESFPPESIAELIAARLGENGAPLAARVPLLRGSVSDQLVASFASKNGLVGAAVWILGPDFPVLTLNELRLVLRLAQTYGVDDARELLPELAAIVGAGFGLRALARELLELIPFAGWAVKGAVAYGGTRALGEAARQRFSLAAMPPQAAAAPAAP
jgi:uncharacterized protein (DUF697 family)